MGTENILQEGDQTFNTADTQGNVILLPGSEKLLVERSQSENAFHTISALRQSSSNKRSKGRVSALMILLCLMAGLFIGAEIYLYLVKPS